MLTSISLILAIIIFIIFFMSSSGENFSITGSKKSLIKAENQTITELMKNDSDEDGIADWEEALWGTDKNKKITFDDTPDIAYIENKKKELKMEQGVSLDEQNLTETEKFAREFFTSYTAMKSSGQIDNDAINNFSNALGQKIVNPELLDRYKDTDIKTNNDDISNVKKKYYTDVQKLFRSYQTAGIGSEIDIISKGLVANSQNGGAGDADQYNKLPIIANAYQDFAKKMIEMTVPKSIADYHLKIINDSNNTGISVLNMAKVIKDPIIGLSGLSQYQKYSEDLVKSVSDLETFLLKQ
jgi:hypothetical protein